MFFYILALNIKSGGVCKMGRVEMAEPHAHVLRVTVEFGECAWLVNMMSVGHMW